MADTLHEYLELTAANDAEVFRRLTAYSAVARKSYGLAAYVGLSNTTELEVPTYLISRSSDLGFNMAGEAASRLPKEVKERHPEVPWSVIRELRDILTHRGEKQLGNREKAFNRICHLKQRLAQTPDLMNQIDKALRAEPDDSIREEIRNIRRGLRYGIAMTVLDRPGEEKKLISPRDELTVAAANFMECTPRTLLIWIGHGAGRCVLVEIGDYLKASSLFVESLDGVASSVPKNFRTLRNDLAHFNDVRRSPSGAPAQQEAYNITRALDHAGKMGPIIQQAIPNTETTENTADGVVHDISYSASNIAANYEVTLTRRIKPEALAYLDDVVKKVTARQPANPRLEQAIIIASSKLLRDRPLNQAQEIIATVLDNAIDPMHRDASGKFDAVDHYRDSCPAPLQSNLRRFVEDIQQRCTRSNSNALV